jgi:hypothetical protein
MTEVFSVSSVVNPALPTASDLGGHVSPSWELWSNPWLLLSNQILKSGV